MNNMRRAYEILIGIEQVSPEVYEDALRTIVEVMKPDCPLCKIKLEVRKFVDSWKDAEQTKPGDVNVDLYCPHCRVRWAQGARDGDDLLKEATE